jgi:hypothetical protein
VSFARVKEIVLKVSAGQKPSDASSASASALPLQPNVSVPHTSSITSSPSSSSSPTPNTASTAPALRPAPPSTAVSPDALANFMDNQVRKQSSLQFNNDLLSAKVKSLQKQLDSKNLMKKRARAAEAQLAAECRRTAAAQNEAAALRNQLRAFENQPSTQLALCFRAVISLQMSCAVQSKSQSPRNEYDVLLPFVLFVTHDRLSLRSGCSLHLDRATLLLQRLSRYCMKQLRKLRAHIRLFAHTATESGPQTQPQTTSIESGMTFTHLQVPQTYLTCFAVSCRCQRQPPFPLHPPPLPLPPQITIRCRRWKAARRPELSLTF